ncbi:MULTISPECIES: Gfo/Idh/MocA family protein [Aeromonas]|uniref:Gfo/Idh/MocA family protein n=1 Tax=Aeromonas TaxID=642 RepID=UPI00102649B2|nr:Gfo/Idh/MocA family oxidoreductase [Aeromonas salmonicida]VFB08759.1 oxidoreductase domain-containing protein [Aeromonas salmonicida]
MERIAVIGLGNISIRHRRNLKQLYPKASIYGMPASGRPSTETISDCDILVTSIEELIGHKVELAIVASPASLHAAHAIPLIKAGIPVLIEKPVATSVADCNAINDASREHNTPVAVGYCLRYLPSAAILKKMLDEQKVGELHNAMIDTGQYLPDWRPSKDYRTCVSARAELGGGVLLELSHEFDYIQWLLGPLTIEHAVLRSSETLGLSVEDSADILAMNTSGVIASIHLDFLQRKAHRKCRFIGSEGTLEWDLVQNQVTLILASGTHVIYSDAEWDKNKMYLAMITDFVHIIHGEESFSTNLRDATNTVALIEKIKEFPLIR